MPMPNGDPQKQPEGGSAANVSPEEVAKLKEQVENLNKGIAAYRQESKSKDDELVTLKKGYQEFQEFKKLLEDSEEDDKEVEIHKDDQAKLEAWAKTKGIVTKAELETERARMMTDSIKNTEAQAVTEFLEKHPEWDADDKWDKFQQEFSQYKQPTSLAGFRKILSKVHGDLSGSKDDSVARAKAEIQVKGRLNLGGGSQRSPLSEGEMTADKLQERYPNLSKEQIQSRVSELDDLYKGRKK